MGIEQPESNVTTAWTQDAARSPWAWVSSSPNRMLQPRGPKTQHDRHGHGYRSARIECYIRVDPRRSTIAMGMGIDQPESNVTTAWTQDAARSPWAWVSISPNRMLQPRGP